ncbi:iron chelate uptake ABC transporter family permease subunit [Leuconostoc lactis]|uniref:iron chelate uptake ABC transporter family permease subunit n=1 Tax=Leuconostoc lactis TaxID=1246 RepID=UPI00289BAC23|nr:iron chelate uptake ABC transporter family permease subunit [Leuconostoc lactis]
MRRWGMLILYLSIVLVVVITLGVPLGQQWPSWDIFWQLRLPRVLFALIGGAMLAVSALIFQTTLRHHYIDASMLGLASGSELGLALLTVVWAPALTYRVAIGAVLAMGWLVVLRRSVLKMGHQPLLLPLGGLALALFFNAGTSLLTNQQGLLGKSLANVTVTDTWLLTVIGLLGLIFIQLRPAQLALFALPQGHIARLGYPESRLSWPWQLVAAGYIGAVSAVLGTIFFVGLIVAQLVRFWFGGSAQQRLLPTALFGTLVLSLSDMLAHSSRYPIELPTGAMLMLLTAPFFMVLWWRQYEN